jgi:hypothetical protein
VRKKTKHAAIPNQCNQYGMDFSMNGMTRGLRGNRIQSRGRCNAQGQAEYSHTTYQEEKGIQERLILIESERQHLAL